MVGLKVKGKPNTKEHGEKRGGAYMAIFHLEFKILKRSEGKSSLYLSAYNSRTRLKDEKTGLVFNYEKKKEDLIYDGILLPENAPDSFKDRSTLWNNIEKGKRKDLQLSRYFIVALPKELTNEQNKNLLKDYLKKNFIKKGMCADFAIHNDHDNNNPHGHVMLTMNDVNETGFLGKNRDWNNKNNVEIWRRSWAVLVNKALRENNKKETITHLSFLKQRELIIKKAKEKIEKNELAEAEKYINLYNDFKTKKPKKRKPRQQYINRKNIRKNTEENLKIINNRQEEKAKRAKKENLINSFFNSIINKLTNKLTNKQKKETEERKEREKRAMVEWQENEDKRAEIKQQKEEALKLKQEQEKQKKEMENERKRERNINTNRATKRRGFKKN